MKDTSQQGLISHTAILNRLVQLGFEVLLPWADHLGYDLAYYIVEEYRSFGFFVHQEARLVRIQCKTGRLVKDGNCFEFSTVSVSAGKVDPDELTERVVSAVRERIDKMVLNTQLLARDEHIIETRASKNDLDNLLELFNKEG